MSLSAIVRGRIGPAAWRSFSRAFVLLGLPLLAWGLADYAGFFSEPARAGYAAVALAQALAIGWIFYVTPAQPPPERHYELPDWHAHLYELILIVAAYGDRRSVLTWNEAPALRWVGVGITALATALVVWANLTWSNHLRGAGASALPDPVLLPEGPFRWVRHPALVSLALLSLGFAILSRSWAGLLLMLPLVAVFVQRIGYSEREHAGRYGRAWIERCRTSWRAVPFLY